MDHLKPPESLVSQDHLIYVRHGKDGNNAGHCSVASGANTKDKKIQCALFLNVPGSKGIEIHRTFTFADAMRKWTK